jgi:anti-sigma B factor antagonist
MAVNAQESPENSCALVWRVACLNKKGELYLKPGKLNAADGLEITVDDGEVGTVFRLRGHINIDSSPALRDRLWARLHGQALAAVTVDLAQVPYIDTSGIATLIEGLKIARNRQIAFCLQGMQGRLLHLVKVTGVLDLFEANGCIVRAAE